MVHMKSQPRWKMNGTPNQISLGGYLDVNKYRYVYFMVFLTLYLLILCCNLTIICLIWIHRNLHEPMYVFIAALSVNSLLSSTAIYPKLIVDVLSSRQIVSHALCLLQYFIFYSLGSSDILLLSAMAFDRYVSICKPLQYPTTMRSASVVAILCLAWILPAFPVLVSAVLTARQKMCRFVLSGIFCNNVIRKLYCVVPGFLTAWGLLTLIDFIVIPVLFIVFTYVKIFVATYRSCGKLGKKAARTCVPHLMVLFSFWCLCGYDIIVVRMDSDLSKTVRLMMSLQIVMWNPLLNPIIYGVKMKEIWKHIKTLLFCQRKRG